MGERGPELTTTRTKTTGRPRRRWRGYDRNSAHHEALEKSEPPTPELERSLLERAAAGRRATHELAGLEARVEELRAAAADGRAARDELVARNLRLAATIAAMYQGFGVSLDDLISAANVGLCVAADRFDSSRTVRFSTYAWHWIKRSVLASLPGASGIRIPVNVYQASLHPERANESMSRYVAAAADARNVERLHDWDLACPVDDPTDARADALDAEVVARLLDSLPATWRDVLVRRFGIGVPAETLLAIGESLGVSKERVRQIEAKALQALRELAGVA